MFDEDKTAGGLILFMSSLVYLSVAVCRVICLRFGHWLTLCTLNMHVGLLFYLTIGNGNEWTCSVFRWTGAAD